MVCVTRGIGSGRYGNLLNLILVLVAAVIVAACATVPHSGRRQFNLIADAQLNALALEAFNEIGKKAPEANDERLQAIVRRVTDRIGHAAEAIDKPGFKWEVRLIESDVPNAFCLPGGKIVVFTGIIPYVKNEAGLAAVVGHEVAHAVARHGAERLSQDLAFKGVLTLGSEALKKKDGTLDEKTKLAMAALGLGATIGVILPYSRLHENEADDIGQDYMAAAGYDPTEAIRVWERMAQIKKPPIPVWLSTHPADEERIEKLKAHLPVAMGLYNRAQKKYGLGSIL